MPVPKPSFEQAELKLLVRAAYTIANQFFEVCTQRRIYPRDRRASLPRPLGPYTQSGLVLAYEGTWPAAVLTPLGAYRFRGAVPAGQSWSTELNEAFCRHLRLGKPRPCGRKAFTQQVPVEQVGEFILPPAKLAEHRPVQDGTGHDTWRAAWAEWD